MRWRAGQADLSGCWALWVARPGDSLAAALLTSRSKARVSSDEVDGLPDTWSERVVELVRYREIRIYLSSFLGILEPHVRKPPTISPTATIVPAKIKKSFQEIGLPNKHITKGYMTKEVHTYITVDLMIRIWSLLSSIKSRFIGANLLKSHDMPKKTPRP